MIDRIILKFREIIHYVFHINIYIGKKVILRGVPKLLYGSNIKFGKNIRINDGVFIHAINGVELGDNTTLSYGASLITESYNTADWEQYLERHHSGGPIIIGNNVWICANVTVLPGITIADDIIVAAGSVVTKNLDCSKSLYAGNPAKLIKSLEK